MNTLDKLYFLALSESTTFMQELAAVQNEVLHKFKNYVACRSCARQQFIVQAVAIECNFRTSIGVM